MELRQYQQEARDRILGEWDAGINRTLLVLPTGCGKTICFASVTEEIVRRGKRVLILAHRKELLDQAADKLHKVTGLACAVEKGIESAIDSWYRVTVGSVQTLMRDDRRADYDPDYYGAIIVDEAHHAVSESYQKILAHFPEAKVLGVTATPDRGDMRNLGEIFQSLAYEYSLPQAIRDGYLSKIKALTLPINIDLSGVAQQSGDFKLSDVANALDPYLESIAEQMKEYCMDRKTLVFLPLVATSQKMEGILRAKGFNVREVNCNSEDRDDVKKWYETSGAGSVVCNSMLWTEGFDEPSVDCIICLRPTKIRSLYCQITGRGTRTLTGVIDKLKTREERLEAIAGSAKQNLLVLDFLWHTDKHSLCRPANLICDNAELASKVTEILARDENKEGADLEAVTAQGSMEVIEERENKLAEKLEAMRHRKKALVDPLQFEMSIKSEDLACYEPAFASEMGPPSEKQIKMLESAGICPDEVKNAGIASKLIEKINNRRAAGLSTPKQIRFLERLNFQHVGTWEFSEARLLIDRIAGNHWRVPNGISPRTYIPTTTRNIE